MGMSTFAYNAIQNSQVSWIYGQCGIPNFCKFAFLKLLHRATNSFSIMSDLSSSDCSEPLSPPLATSSPLKQRNNNSNCSSTRPSKTSRPFTKKQTQKKPTKRQSLKTLVKNFCSIRNKVSDLAVCIEIYSPDIITGTETHLDSSVSSSDLFPSNYSIIRKDRDFDNFKGGVLIAIKNYLIGTHRKELDTNCEIIWVTIKIQGSKDITIGAFYRSPQSGNTNDYMNELRESINKIKRSDNEQIWLAGDFNLPDIDWDLLGTKPSGAAPGLSIQLIEIANDFGLEQVVRGPTRINNTLDLFFTTNPTTVERSTVVPGIGDHDGIPVIINSCKLSNKNRAKYTCITKLTYRL